MLVASSSTFEELSFAASASRPAGAEAGPDEAVLGASRESDASAGPTIESVADVGIAFAIVLLGLAEGPALVCCPVGSGGQKGVEDCKVDFGATPLAVASTTGTGRGGEEVAIELPILWSSRDDSTGI